MKVVPHELRDSARRRATPTPARDRTLAVLSFLPGELGRGLGPGPFIDLSNPAVDVCASAAGARPRERCPVQIRGRASLAVRTRKHAGLVLAFYSAPDASLTGGP